MLLCFMLNINSSILGVLAILQSIKVSLVMYAMCVWKLHWHMQCEEHKKNGRYRLAKHHSKIARRINIANILFTAATSITLATLVL